MKTEADEYVVAWPTLGFLVADWVERHCVVPDRFNKGDPFVMYDWQLWCTVNHYRVKPDVAWRPDDPILGPAFYYRRSQVVAPQKTGKGPWTATIVCNEAVGPALFAGWAEAGETYDCQDYDCDCGWVYEYESGEPMGMPWPTPLIQLLATAEDQTDNVYRPLQAMIKHGPLSERMRVGEEFIRLPNDGRIDVVTSSAQARLGNPVTFAPQDETGLYTKQNGMVRVAETQRRGVAGMGGRSMETTNPWDPSEESTAQRTYESQRPDIFKFYRMPPANLSYKNKAERRKVHVYVYAGSNHVDLDGIEAEAAELMEKDPQQAERFFGNRVVYGAGTWLDGDVWDELAAPRDVPDGTAIVCGFDGSDVDDWTGIRAETRDGYQFTPTYGPDKRPTIWNPADFGGQVPRLEVAAAVAELFERFVVVRWYGDPPGWETEHDGWAAKYGDKRVLRWPTYRMVPMHAAAERLHVDVTKTDTTWSHDGCDVTKIHVRNARKSPRPGKPPRYVLAKASPTQKIDLCISSIVVHEAAGDVTAAKLWPAPKNAKMIVLR